MKEQKTWESYEGVATYLLQQMKETFGLDSVEGKQNIEGVSGTDWEIDAKGIRKDDTGIILIECRRYTTSKLKQEDMAAIAYRIKDTGAKGGIIVTPIGLQEGAKIIAEKEGIIVVRLSPESDEQQYLLQFLNQIFVGVSDVISMTDRVHMKVIHADGSMEEHSSN